MGGREDWFFTIGGREFREDVKNLGRQLKRLADQREGADTLATLDAVALELFKAEMKNIDALNPANDERLDRAVRHSYVAAKRFLEQRQIMLEEFDEQKPPEEK